MELNVETCFFIQKCKANGSFTVINKYSTSFRAQERWVFVNFVRIFFFIAFWLLTNLLETKGGMVNFRIVGTKK